MSDPSPPSPERRGRIERLFEAALERPPDERRSWIASASAGDPSLADDVLALLAAHERAEGILDADPARAASRLLDGLVAGSRLGPYRVLEELGRGGMGVVYLAERDDGQFRRRVAVKVIRGGIDAEELHVRFLAERHILAALDHPNIARVLDGGLTDDGRPYLVMEYAPGQPVDLHCDAARLSVEERLRLFCVIARAVQHAHRNLVVHRDLKPSNILVGPDGAVKLVDFGIAKILDPVAFGLEEASPVTRTGARPMTPEYASPEQVRGGPITTAHDIWSLGVVLYELLTGRHPFRLRGRSMTERERVILEEEPARPSTVVRRQRGTVGDRDSNDAPGGPPRRGLRRRLRGDLDRIVLTALRKEPERRYASAERMAEDVERHLAGLPVSAREDSIAYRTRKFVARHPWGIAAAGALVLVLLAYAVTVTVQGNRVRAALEEARSEADRSSQITDLLLGLFETGSAAGAGTDTTAIRALLERGLARADQLRQHPEARAQVLASLGKVHGHLGGYAEAAALLEEALELRRRVHGDRHPLVAEASVVLADAYRATSRLPEAERLLRSALDVERELLGERHPRVARTLAELAVVRRDAGDLAGAESLAREALAVRRRLLGNGHPDVAAVANTLAGILRRRGDLAGAGPLYREALAIRRRLYQGDRMEVAESLNNLAVYLEATGDVEAAEPLYREALGMYRRLVGDEHPAAAGTQGSLGLVVGRLGDAEESERLLREALAIARRVHGPAHPQVALSLRLLGLQLTRRGAFREAEPHYRESVEILREVLEPRHPELALGLHGLGSALRRGGEPGAAEPHLREALEIRRAALGERHPLTANTLHELGAALRAGGAAAEAEALLLAALDVRRAGRDEEGIAETAAELVLLYEAQGRGAEARRYEALVRSESP